MIALAGVLTPASAFATTPVSLPAGLHTVVEASQLHPKVVIPGDIVDVTLRTGETRIVLNGPATPPVIADAVPGTFTFFSCAEERRNTYQCKGFWNFGWRCCAH